MMLRIKAMEYWYLEDTQIPRLQGTSEEMLVMTYATESNLQIGAVRVRAISTLCPKRSRMLSMRYLIIVGRSKDRPQAITLTFSGSPIGCNISGRNIPEFPISVHFLRSG